MFGDLPVSGIHRLFSAAQSSQSCRPPHLESVTEESHTYDLLWPDLDALHQSQDQIYPLRQGNNTSSASAAGSFDDRGGLDIQSPRDIRIIVAQDGNCSQQAKVLYDTHPPPLPPAARLGSFAVAKGGKSGQLSGPPNKAPTSPQAPSRFEHKRYLSLGRSAQAPPLEQPSPLAPAPEHRDVFANSRLQRTNTRPATSDGETHQGRLAREGKEEVDALLDCMFGSTHLPMVSGTKLHIRPSGTMASGSTKRSDTYPLSPEQGPSQPNMRKRTPLTRSTTADDLHRMSTSVPGEGLGSHLPRTQSTSVLITRLFTIDASEPLSPRPRSTEEQRPHAESEMQHQSPQTAKRYSRVTEPSAARQFKCPAYALSLMLRLPSASAHGWPSAPQMASALLPDQLGASTASPWQEAKALDGSLHGADSDMAHIILHWSLLTKLSDIFESYLRQEISYSLASADLGSMDPPLPISLNPGDGSLKDHPKSPLKKTMPPFQRTIQLPANALQKSQQVQHEAFRFGQRVALILRTRRVVTGQSRWGVWREEARWVGRWAGNREQNFFFYNLLTAFLGFHLDWLESLEGMRKRRHRSRSEKRREADLVSQQQTVIVSPNKMASRRLIFLLAIFLPGAASQVQDPMMVPKSNGIGPSSQSPPSGIPILRELSLRRTINRRQRGNRSSQGSTAFHTRSFSLGGGESTIDAEEEQTMHGRSAQHSRRASTARSIMTPSLPIAVGGENTRKSSTTTSSTVVPGTPVPAAHFSTFSPDPLMGTTPAPRPGSSGSLASLSLQHTLHRSESSEQSNASTASQSLGRWGSMMSGFWSSRRESSTEGSGSFLPSTEGLGITGLSKMPGQSDSIGSLERMVEEAETVSQAKHKRDIAGHSSQELFRSPGTVGESFDRETAPGLGDAMTEARAIPERPRGEIFPIKLSVDDGDGIIDVDLPALTSYASSIGSSVGSTGHACTAPNSFDERSSIFTRSPNKVRSRHLSESSADVAGWLKEYSPSYVLQAVKPYQRLREDIDEAMGSGSSSRPSTTLAFSRGWRDVRATMVADTTNYTITRVCLQQRLRSEKQPSAYPSAFAATEEPAEQAMEERIIEEPIMDHDPILIDAVERILAQSGQSSRVQSRAPSRATSPSRSARSSEKARSKSNHDSNPMSMDKESIQNPALQVPKSECKKLVFGALEEVVRSVQAEQGTGSEGARHISGEPVRSGKVDFAQDSTLREGVRKWFKATGAVSVAV
ncbi:MAG: hypothetical protein L6R39_005640 [Caloplaca ligustica]|nr:MAG: hypothetical protein L6R39_005640 [Caloplaca ligustica]